LIEQLRFVVMLPQQLANSVKGRVEGLREEGASNSWGSADSSVTGQRGCVSSRQWPAAAAGIVQLAVIPEAGIQGTLAAISGFGNH